LFHVSFYRPVSDKWSYHGILSSDVYLRRVRDEGDTNIQAFHRFSAPLNVNCKARLVKLTVKEFVSDAQGNKLYTVESIELDENTSNAQWVDSTVQDDNLNPTSIRSVEAVIILEQIQPNEQLCKFRIRTRFTSNGTQ
jgi:hypothetical protein